MNINFSEDFGFLLNTVTLRIVVFSVFYSLAHCTKLWSLLPFCNCLLPPHRTAVENWISWWYMCVAVAPRTRIGILKKKNKTHHCTYHSYWYLGVCMSRIVIRNIMFLSFTRSMVLSVHVNAYVICLYVWCSKQVCFGQWSHPSPPPFQARHPFCPDP